MFGMLAVFRDGFFCCNTVSILFDGNVKIVYMNVHSLIDIFPFSVAFEVDVIVKYAYVRM